MDKDKKRYWTLDTCKKDALNYKTKSDWSNKSSSAYIIARKNGWLNECCKHMEEVRKPKGYWNLETCKEDALKYNSRHEWGLNSRSAYQKAGKEGWLDDCCGHMQLHKKPSGYWTKKLCKIDAKYYKTKREWELNSGSAYHRARKEGWLDECCKHMDVVIKPKGYWSFEACKTDAKRFNTRTEWSKKSSSAYKIARINNWIDECTRHMKLLIKPRRYWTLKTCKADAKNFKTKTEWSKKSSGAYQIACINNWKDECTKHMSPQK